jgi:uncharacterized membrane protein
MGKLLEFYKPNLLNISMALLCLGLTLKFIVPLLSHIVAVPCLMYAEKDMALCPINPNPDVSTLYLGFLMGDWIYQIIYLALILVVIPYTMSCAIFKLYYSFLKKRIG